MQNRPTAYSGNQSWQRGAEVRLGSSELEHEPDQRWSSSTGCFLIGSLVRGSANKGVATLIVRWNRVACKKRKEKWWRLGFPWPRGCLGTLTWTQTAPRTTPGWPRLMDPSRGVSTTKMLAQNPTLYSRIMGNDDNGIELIIPLMSTYASHCRTDQGRPHKNTLRSF